MSTENRLLASMPRKSRAEILRRCETIVLPFGEVLCEAFQPIEHVYFPLQGFISRTCALDDHQPLEIGLIGNEGMLGETLVLGVNAAPMRAVVQGAGSAFRLPAADFRRELRREPGLLRVLGRYVYLLITQMAHSAACTRFHEIEPRLARWLLMTHDRTHTDHFYLTHQFLADMLGVRRSGVSIAAHELQRKHLIGYSRGDIQVLDRKGLEAAACTCYASLELYEKNFRAQR